MKHHQLKIEQSYYTDVYSGRKSFEIRKDDRGYQVGDIISFTTTSDGKSLKPDNKKKWEIVYIFGHEDSHKNMLQEGYVVLGIQELAI